MTRIGGIDPGRKAAGLISGYFNKSVFLVVTLTEEYKVFGSAYEHQIVRSDS